ncbi:hypothetical protein [Cuspidothrix issatschenkoi]|jgi:hypothetical protein|uniref:Uncharacterized protein n=1 Tax=Cuspidothrix issatschenkoi CHARLIE-1 TaxID=2052836 RepID=A0A2S6CQU8_9CYAN|nr:hypothetical protein [Cuspidothrix issatschenkoi]PPJ62118.1 hypothetical protein CUN59_17185 [Cuspidothrix issatschenkoi CHARLIE-1]
MSIWIVTTGNSDVIIKDDHNWSKFHDQALDKLECWDFGSVNRIDPSDKTAGYTIAARVLGIVYQDQLDDHFNDLSFPLLDGFTEHLKSKNDSKNLIVDKILVILTNQKNVFKPNEIEDSKCPYWQDTCTLKPIFEKYFTTNFPNFKKQIEYLELTPDSPDEGLDNWDKCLLLVNSLFQQKITDIISKTEKKKNDKHNKIFVSHQAGTPAISSAIQFSSLAKFENEVEFLVSNQYKREKILTISSSNYLKGLKLQEAKELLDRYDYLGVNKIFAELCKNKSLTEKEQKIKDLLAMAIQWNNANFDDFAKARSITNGDAKKRTQEWWWTSYEAGYLAVIRFRQGNYVETSFHSFRAVEGLLRYLDKNKYEYKGIHDLVEIVLPNWQSSDDIKIFKNFASRERNNLFHNLQGLEEKEVFKAWNTSDYTTWQNRVLGCINFIISESDQKFAKSDQKFTKLQDSSLMSSVHEELKTAINNYELQAPS